jgi:uncharacterized membrane protein YhaH (DUF805 family)
VNRLQLFLGSNLLALAAFFLMMTFIPLVAPKAGSGYVMTGEAWVVTLASQLLTAPFQASLLVRRGHDLNISGRWAVAAYLIAIPGIVVLSLNPGSLNTIAVLSVLPLSAMTVALLIALGETQENRFGPPPRAGWLP